MIEVDEIGPDDWQRFRDIRRASLEEAPYAFYSTLAEWSGEGDTEERWRARLTDVPYNLVARAHDIDAGVVSALENEDGSVELISMWVSPRFRAQRVGDRLVGKVVAWASGLGRKRVTLGVKATNTAAIRFYERNGFVDAGWYAPGGADDADGSDDSDGADGADGFDDSDDSDSAGGAGGGQHSPYRRMNLNLS